MIRDYLRRLQPHRRQLAVAAALLVTVLGLVTARAAGIVDPAALLSPAPAATPSSATPTGQAATAAPSSAVAQGGAKNIVQVLNHTDGKLRTGGQVKLEPVPGPNVAPVNTALAYSSCVRCETFAVALQINMVGPKASSFAPQNAASAVNYHCTGCVTVALAYQYNIQVADPTQTPDRVHQLIAMMNKELQSIGSDPSMTLSGAEARIVAVIGQFQDLASYLVTSRQQSTAASDPGATPAPDSGAPTTPTATASPTSSPSASSTPSPAASATASPSASPSASPTP